MLGPAGTQLFAQGAPCQGFPLVLAGEVRVACHHKTGVEMEALTAASVGALTVYDMCKALSHDIVIKEIRLMEKTGGKSDFHAGTGARVA